MTYADTVKFLVSMIIMMNPLGSLSIFLQLTGKSSVKKQRKIALNCSLGVLVIMVVTLWIGNDLLSLLGITIDSFRFAGGIILLLTGLSMLQSKESPMSHTPDDDVAAEERHSVAIVPMALPVIMGPGSISTLILASSDYPTFFLQLWLTLLCVGLTVTVGLILYFGGTIAKIVGDSVIKVITRIMGMLIMAIAAGMLASSLNGLIPALR